MGPKWICIMVIMWVSIDGGWCHGCWEQERLALLQLKPSFNNLNWLEGNETSNCCMWEFVECSRATGRVVTLILDGRRGLDLPVFYINASMFLPFEELKELYLGDNHIVGCIENEGFEILSSRLRNLEVLKLGYNNFDNSIISSLRGLSSLKVLNLESNQLKGTIHTHEFYGLNNLEELYMNENKIEFFGSLQGKSTLNKLKVLDLGSQQINTSILVQSLGSFPNLKTLYLRNNSLNGTTTNQELGNLSALEELSLEGSLQRADFLQGIGSLTSLKILSASGCGLKGILPNQGWCDLKNLQVLYLFSNELEGTLPPCVGNLSSIESLRVEGNHIEVPMSLKPLANLSNLKDFSADNIVLDLDIQFWTPRFQLQSLVFESSLFEKSKPHLPNFLYYQNELRYIRLSGCGFGGVFPAWLLHNNTSLESIDFGGNYLKGTISSEFCKLPILRLLDLSNNYLSGSIPPCFRRLQSLISLHLNNNRLQGQLPNDFLNNSIIMEIDLGYNSFSGSIPNWISNSSALVVLLLRGNQFHGEIPIGLCNLKKVSFLDLSLNNLSGRLPPCLSKLKCNDRSGGYVYVEEFFEKGIAEFMVKSMYLNYSGMIINYMFGIDLSCNKFSGEIPPEFGNLSDVKSLNLSHNNLIGSIPTTFGKLKQIESLDLSYNYLIGLVPPQLTELNFLADFKVAHNNLSGPLPNMKGQFITFDESSYEGNHFLCGPPLTKSCKNTSSVLPSPNAFLGEDDGLMDMSAFYVTFMVSYVMVLLGTMAVLYINPYWRQAWFYHIEVCITACFYLMEDNFTGMRNSFCRW